MSPFVTRLVFLAALGGCRQDRAHTDQTTPTSEWCERLMASHLTESAVALADMDAIGVSPSFPRRLRRMITFGWLGLPGCSFPETVPDHSSHVSELMDIGLNKLATAHVSMLAKLPTRSWPAQRHSDLSIKAGGLARTYRLERFHVEAWTRHRPTLDDRPDPHARAYTLLDGAAVAWHYALAEHERLFGAVADDPGLEQAISSALGKLELKPPARTPATPFATWLWNAPNESLNAQAEAFAARASLLHDDPKLEDLARGRYAVQTFRSALAEVLK